MALVYALELDAYTRRIYGGEEFYRMYDALYALSPDKFDYGSQHQDLGPFDSLEPYLIRYLEIFEQSAYWGGERMTYPAAQDHLDSVENLMREGTMMRRLSELLPPDLILLWTDLLRDRDDDALDSVEAELERRLTEGEWSLRVEQGNAIFDLADSLEQSDEKMVANLDNCWLPFIEPMVCERCAEFLPANPDSGGVCPCSPSS